MWKSLNNDIVNIHEHESSLFPKYEHGPGLNRDWILPGNEPLKRNLCRYIKMNPVMMEQNHFCWLGPLHQFFKKKCTHLQVNFIGCLAQKL